MLLSKNHFSNGEPQKSPNKGTGSSALRANPRWSPSMFCRHCQKAPASRPRGLCWECYDRPDVREQYPMKFVAPRYCQKPKPLPPEATDAQPGTPAKVEVLCHRFALRYDLWHPADARLGDKR
jgi:hypothetical protein